jgi:hypothetical protein
VWDNIVGGAPVTLARALQGDTSGDEDEEDGEVSDNDERASTAVTIGDPLELGVNYPGSQVRDEEENETTPSQASSQVLPRDHLETRDDVDDDDKDDDAAA